MNGFSDLPFAHRFNAMGDRAEAIFDSIYPSAHKLGLNRPLFSVAGMPAPLRHTPDRMDRRGLHEVMGVGRDGILKMKDEKLDALWQWRRLGDVHLFVYDSAHNMYYHDELTAWTRQIDAYGEPGTFSSDGKDYAGLRIEHFPTQGVPL